RRKTHVLAPCPCFDRCMVRAGRAAAIGQVTCRQRRERAEPPRARLPLADPLRGERRCGAARAAGAHFPPQPPNHERGALLPPTSRYSCAVRRADATTTVPVRDVIHRRTRNGRVQGGELVVHRASRIARLAELLATHLDA